MRLAVQLALILALSASGAVAQSADPPVTVEVFQVLEFPVAINNPVLVKAKGGYLLKCSLSNSSEFRQLGLRYSLAVIDSADTANYRIISRNEGFAVAAYQIRNVTFKTPLKLSLKANQRLVLMLEQLISTDYVWNVMNPKEALAAYIAGEYSTIPRVLRVTNQVDARPLLRLTYQGLP